MSSSVLTVTAMFEDGVLRPDQPLPLAPRQRVTIVVEIPEQPKSWPENVADIYRDIADEDRRLSEAMFGGIRETWPTSEEPH